MPSGGKRQGAGRPSGTKKLSFLERIRIGAYCESLWRKQKDIKEEQAISEATKTQAIEWAKAKAIPINERKKWLVSEEGQDYLEDVEYALRTDRGLTDDEEIRSMSSTSKFTGTRDVFPKQPKGYRKTIISEASSQFTVSERMVETCWKEFRRFEREE